ncbi:hypothetical protein LINPERPRIM_LOCUS33951 [Linum perenne]
MSSSSSRFSNFVAGSGRLLCVISIGRLTKWLASLLISAIARP